MVPFVFLRCQYFLGKGEGVGKMTQFSAKIENAEKITVIFYLIIVPENFWHTT